MSFGLSPQNERYLEQQVADGVYSSKEAALDAAVSALRSQDGSIPQVPQEHVAALEDALADFAQNGAEEMTDSEWDELRQLARDVAEGRSPVDK